MKENELKTPAIAEKLLKWILPASEKESITGDYEELYFDLFETKGRLFAGFWYRLQVLKSAWSVITVSLYWNFVMFKSYMKIAVRNFRKQKVYSFINISGLAVGMACCILIFLFVQEEFSYDRFHKNADRIYRVTSHAKTPVKINKLAMLKYKLHNALKEEFPELENVTAFKRPVATYLNIKGTEYKQNVCYAKNNFLDFFTFPLVSGDEKTALYDPSSIIITESTAKKIYGNDNPIGRIINFEKKLDLKITGILKDIPENSHIKFDMITSYANYKKLSGMDPYYTYSFILLGRNNSPRELEAKFPGYLKKHLGEKSAKNRSLVLQPLTDIHLKSRASLDLSKNSDAIYSYILTAIASFILIIACINYINLTTARSASRAKEIGLRKVVGANKTKIVIQFLGESVSLTFIALIISVVLVQLFLPAFNNVAGKNLSLDFSSNIVLVPALLFMTLFVGILSGCYSAFFLSGFETAEIIRGNIKTKNSGNFIRKGLVVFQFAVSLVFIAGTVIIGRQIHFLNSRDLGFNKDNVAVVSFYNLESKEKQERFELIKNEFLQYQGIISASASMTIPGFDGGMKYKVIPEGYNEGEDMTANLVYIDNDFFDTYEIQIIEGRNFSKDFSTDIGKAVILNKTAVKQAGWKSPLGKMIDIDGEKHHVIGIIKDFHLESLHNQIKPMLFFFSPASLVEISLKLNPDNIPETMAYIENKWKSFNQGNMRYRYYFVDERISKFYRLEQRSYSIVIYAALTAIILACLGLLGLASFSAEQRTKEIGIRKTVGASILNIVTLLTKDFAKWVAVANIIAWPVIYIIMQKWLQNFAYRIEMNIWFFLLSGIIALFIALLTVSYQAVKAANTNPVKALKYE